jgi:hypothetical protein
VRRIYAALLDHYSFVIDGAEDREQMADTLARAVTEDGLVVQLDEEIPQPLTVNRLAEHASLGEVVLELKVTHEGVILDVFERGEDRGAAQPIDTAALDWDDLVELCH